MRLLVRHADNSTILFLTNLFHFRFHIDFLVPHAGNFFLCSKSSFLFQQILAWFLCIIDHDGHVLIFQWKHLSNWCKSVTLLVTSTILHFICALSILVIALNYAFLYFLQIGRSIVMILRLFDICTFASSRVSLNGASKKSEKPVLNKFQKVTLNANLKLFS